MPRGPRSLLIVHYHSSTGTYKRTPPSLFTPPLLTTTLLNVVFLTSVEEDTEGKIYP